MAHRFALHSGIPNGDPVKMTLLSHLEKEFQLVDVLILIGEDLESQLQSIGSLLVAPLCVNCVNYFLIGMKLALGAMLIIEN